MLQKILREKYKIDIPDNMAVGFDVLVNTNRIKVEGIYKLIEETIKKNPYTWYKTKELNNRDTPLYYTREPNSFQADDFCICKEEKGNEYIATQYKNSIEEKLLGKDKNIEKLRRRIENYVLLLMIREELNRLNITE
jgi:hypothetical protein